MTKTKLISWILASLGIGGTTGAVIDDKVIDIVTNRNHTHSQYALIAEQTHDCEGDVRWEETTDGTLRLIDK